MIEYKELIDYPCRFNPKENYLKEVFADDIARAIWMAYRGTHVCSDRMMLSLARGSLLISEILKRNPAIISKNALDLGRWIGEIICDRSIMAKGLFLTNEEDMTNFGEFIRPYLQHKKIPTWKIVNEEFVDGY